MRIPALGRRTGRLAKLALFPAVALLLAACTDASLNQNQTGDDAAPGLFTGEVVTVQGAEAASLYLPIFIVATIIFFLVEGLLLFMAFRFRRRSSGTDLPAQTHGNNKLEIIWTVVPAIIVTVMFIGSTMVLSNVEAKSDEPAVVVDVLAESFGWTFTYQELDSATGEYVNTDVVTYGNTTKPSSVNPAPQPFEVVLPVNQPIRFIVRAKQDDVIHSFYVPSFFYKIDAIPGRTNEFEVTIEKPGTYGGQCAEFCGMLHSQMFFSIRAVEQAEYDAWIEEKSGGAAAATVGGTS